MRSPIPSDPRHFQILFQSLFLLYGCCYFDWWEYCPLYLAYFGSSLATQMLAEYWVHGRWCRDLRSVVVSSFGLCLLLKTDALEVALLAGFLSVASKYILRFRGAHLFNPSAFGIVATILITGKAWLSPGQWGAGVVLATGVCLFGAIVVSRVQRWEVSVAFLLSFGGLLAARQLIYLDWPMDHFLQSMTTGSLLLFSFFMITDPKTVPQHAVSRMAWCMAVAGLAFYLSAFQFVTAAPVWALVILQPVVPMLNFLFKGDAFRWKPAPLLHSTHPSMLLKA